MVQGATTYGVELLLTGNAEDLTAELSQTELIYARSPGYDGPDAIQVVLHILSHQFSALSPRFPVAGCVSCCTWRDEFVAAVLVNVRSLRVIWQSSGM